MSTFRILVTTYDLHDTDPYTGGYSINRIRELPERYEIKKEAVRAAIKLRDRNCLFEGWEELGLKNKPPFQSWEIENLDEDEGCCIEIEEIQQPALQEVQETPMKERIAKKKLPAPPPPEKRVFGKVAITDYYRSDKEYFQNCPSPLVVAVAKHPDDFPSNGEFVDLVRRFNICSYAVKALCSGGFGAKYAIKSIQRKRPSRYMIYSIIWIPPTDYDLTTHVGDPSVLDTIHTDLIDNRTGAPRLSPRAFAALCSPTIKHLFLNKFSEAGHLTDAEWTLVAGGIRKCTSLETFSAFEWLHVPRHVLDALAASTLQGIHLHACSGCNVAGLETLVRASTSLQWFGLEDSRASHSELILAALPPASIRVVHIRSSYRGSTAAAKRILDNCTNLKVRLAFVDDKYENSL